MATDTLAERKSAKVGFLTTEGFRDLLEMREGLKEDRYNLRTQPVAGLQRTQRPSTSPTRLGPQERLLHLNLRESAMSLVSGTTKYENPAWP